MFQPHAGIKLEGVEGSREVESGKLEVFHADC